MFDFIFNWSEISTYIYGYKMLLGTCLQCRMIKPSMSIISNTTSSLKTTQCKHKGPNGWSHIFLMANKYENMMFFKPVTTQIQLKIIYLVYQVKLKKIKKLF